MGRKFLLLGYFCTGIWKNHCHIWNQHLRIWQNRYFHVKQKILIFGLKNASFGYFLDNEIWDQIVLLEYFWTGIWKNYCHIWNRHLRICQPAKLPYLGIFGLELEKTLVILDISTVDFIKNEFLTNIDNFNIGPMVHFFWRSMSRFGSVK